MPLPSKIVVPAPVPRAALLGAGVSVPQLQPSFCDATASASDGSSSPAGEFARAMSVDAPQSSSSQELQRSRREVTSLRASLDRTNRALRGLPPRLSTRDRKLQRAKADKDTLANQVAQQDTLITTLTDELTALRAQVDELRVQLDFLEARRATAARRFSFFEARARRFEYENEGLLVELECRMQELRFAQDALQATPT